MEGIEELKQESAQWTLASDEKLLAVLRKFSVNISNKTRELVKRVDDLGSDVCVTEVRLRNTFNEFMILANTQFIENVSLLSKYSTLLNYICRGFMTMMKTVKVMKKQKK